MKIIITRPSGIGHSFEQQFLFHWHSVSKALTGNPAVIVEANPHEIHGDLLSRIWSDLRNCKEPILISESDFWPYRDEISDLLHHAERRNRAAAFTEYCRRGPGPGGAELILLRHQPLVAPWFMLLLPQNFKADPPLDWLAPGGPFNDAANLAYLKGVEAGVFYEADVKWVQRSAALGPSIKPPAAVVQYLHGTHFFFTRHWNDSPETILLPDGYNVRTHLMVIEGWLKRGIS